MVSPSPTPWTPLRVVFRSRVKGSKICLRNSSLIPMPVSRTAIRYTAEDPVSCSPSPAEMDTLPPEGV